MQPTKFNVRCASHLVGVLNPYKRGRVISECIHALTPHKNKFDAIAVSGYSMALIAPTIADEMGKGLIIVRKYEDDCASDYRVEGMLCNNYIIIDDLVCSGGTFHRVKDSIQNFHHTFENPCKLYGIYLYDIHNSGYRTHSAVEYHLKTKLLNTVDQLKRSSDVS